MKNSPGVQTALSGLYRPVLRWNGSRRLLAALTSLLLLCGFAIAVPAAARADSVAATCTGNAIVCENQLPGTPQSTWDVTDEGDKDIQGFATQISVNVGQSVQFKIDTTARAYKIEIYRLGYYQGNGARKQADVTPSATLPQVQPACATDPATEIYDCGTWGVSASWNVPSTAVSGVYIARLIRTDNGDSSHIPFIVRDDSSHSDVVFQTSDPTWEAYNTYGQSDFYQGLANGRAYKVSYNRPIVTRGNTYGRDFLFSNEYPMIRYLEQNGYDVSYISGLDTDIHGSMLTNHKVFTSVGHDEYWSAGQRSSVEAARDAGVSLAFFSGNEVYWKTRWEASEDGTATANRTLVCYKDTWADQQIDPLGPTATWRDPRWGGNGKGPENALTGTLYMANSDDLPITVSALEGKLRLWRDTTLASQPVGGSTALAAHTIGYESDEDLDNGSRPAGLIDLSTTVGQTPQYLQDFGSTVAPGTTTHHLTLYRAPSGALVFGAGTIQWAWGVDSDHDGTAGPADVRMRQATMNILADMGASATTIAAGLVAETKSADTAAPTAVINSPAAGAQIPQGAQVTVTGTAADTGGGVVAGVEVSVDGGLTWHPATGTSSFTYSGILTAAGPGAIQVRATDDSANIQTPTASLPIVSGCPCSIFGATVPGTPAVSDTSSVTLGVKFTSSSDGFINGIRFYKGPGNTGTHVGTLYSSAGAPLATVTFTNETTSGWQSASFAATVPIAAGVTYTAAYTAPNGHYAGDNYYFVSKSHTAGTLTALGGPGTPANGVFADGAGFPAGSYHNTNYYVDAVYSPTDTTPLTAATPTPLDGSSSVPTSVAPTAKFSRSITASSIAMTLTDASNALVPANVTYDANSRIVTLNPTVALNSGVTYTARLNATSPDVGPMAAPIVWSFTTAKAPAVPGVCPCTLFNDTDGPSVGPDSGGSVEVGTAFTADRNGSITGVKFYKDPSNTGVHTVSLWTSAGALVARATVATETTSGWQEGDFAGPVSINSDTVYLVSYRAPTGHYSYANGGLAAAIDRSPLHTPSGAGRYTYGTSGPTSGSGANYFVDPVFNPSPDQAPAVVTIDPGTNSTSVPVGGSITATFNETVNSSTAVMTVTDPNGASIVGTVAGESLSKTVTFVPGAPLTASTLYTVSVSGVVSSGGTSMASTYVSHFTTSGVTSCPCTVMSSSANPQLSDSGDAGPVTVGLRFSPSVDGFVSGVRYYADAANTGNHTGTLYSSAGTALTTVTFPPIQSAGWQYATFDAPVQVSAGSVYTAAVFMPVGHYSVTSGFFAAPYVNAPLTGQMGLYTYGSDTLPTSSYNNANYFVDAMFAPTSVSPPAPTVSAQSPADGATAVAVSTAVAGAFNTAINPTTLQLTVTGPGGAPVAGTVSYVSTTRTASFQPAAPLTNGSTYTVLLSAQGSAGAVMSAPATWSFTTVAAPAPTVSGQTPAPGATGVSASAPTTGVFSVPIDQSTLIFTLAQNGVPLAGITTYDAPSRTATFQPAAVLSPNTTYNASLSAKNTAGGAMAAPATWSYSTSAAAPPAPTVTGVTPVSGATAVPTASSLTGTFSIAMNVATLTFAITSSGGVAVSGTTTYNTTTNVATFKPSTALAYQTTYAVLLSGTSSAGAAMAAPMSWSFTTAAPPVPTVTAKSPVAGASGVAVAASVTGTFGVAVDPASLVFSLTTSGGSSVSGAVTYNSVSRVATFKPSVALAYSATYSASLQATGSSGGVMAAPVLWSFTTAAPPVPTVTAKSPVAGASGVAVAASVTGTFGVAVDPASLVFSLTTSGGSTVSGAVTYNSVSRVATFKPSVALAYSATYSASLQATGSSGGVMAAPVLWSFTTVAPPVPTVTGQSPLPGAVNTSRSASVTAKFSVPVTVSTLVFTLRTSSGTPVVGTVTYNTATNVATLKPAASLSAFTSYTASLSATGSSGGVMTAPVQWSYTTGA